MSSGSKRSWFHRLLDNSRFWVLSSGIVLSMLIAGAVQYEVASGIPQTIWLEQIYGYLSMAFLYLALLATPLTYAMPNLSYKEQYLHARRAIGVLAFYYGFLHTYITFFKQLNGFGGLAYLTSSIAISVAVGAISLLILFAMALTSTDWAVDMLGFKNWKRLHRFVYLAGMLILLHLALVGPHYSSFNGIGLIMAVAVLVLVVLEANRIINKRRQNNKATRKRSK